MNIEEEKQIYDCYEVETDLGLILLYYNEDGIYKLILPSEVDGNRIKSNIRNYKFPWPDLENELQVFCQGQKIRNTYPLVTKNYSKWTKKVLQVVGNIPYGETLSYKQVAEQLGKPAAARAVGQALSCNRTPILIPCHRVVGQKGDLVGFGPGLLWKQRLLELERKVI